MSNNQTNTESKGLNHFSYPQGWIFSVNQQEADKAAKKKGWL
jgi:hypothetical protein